MTVPSTDVAGCADAHRRLRVVIDGLEGEIHRLSALPEWTVEHVLTHLARNAEAMCLRIEGAQRGELVEQYPGGASGRERHIATGAARPASEIVADVHHWSDRIDELFGALSEIEWELPVRTVAGWEHPIRRLPFRRWREVEVHLVDLDVGLTPSDWPAEFVGRALPQLLERLPERGDRRELTAWLFGRGPAPDLDRWA